MSIDASPPPNLPPADAKGSRVGLVLGIAGGGCLLVVLLCGGGFALLFAGVFSLIKGSDPYTDSLARASQNPAVVAALGEPIEAGFLVAGNINLNNDDGDADLSYGISGPQGSGNVKVVGTKTDGSWSYDEMSVTVEETGEVINLLE